MRSQPRSPQPRAGVGGKAPFFQPRQGKLQAFTGAGGTQAGGKSCRDPRAPAARPASPAVPGAGGRFGCRGADTEIAGSPAKPLGLPGSGAAGPGLPRRRTHTHAHTHTHTRAHSHSRSHAQSRTLTRTPAAATRAQGSRSPSGDEPLRLFPSPFGSAPTASEGSRARRSEPSGAEAAAAAPPEVRAPLGAVHHANRLKAAAAAAAAPRRDLPARQPGLRSAARTPRQICRLSPRAKQLPSPGGLLPAADPSATTGTAQRPPRRASPADPGAAPGLVRDGARVCFGGRPRYFIVFSLNGTKKQTNSGATGAPPPRHHPSPAAAFPGGCDYSSRGGSDFFSPALFTAP